MIDIPDHMEDYDPPFNIERWVSQQPKCRWDRCPMFADSTSERGYCHVHEVNARQGIYPEHMEERQAMLP